MEDRTDPSQAVVARGFDALVDAADKAMSQLDDLQARVKAAVALLEARKRALDSNLTYANERMTIDSVLAMFESVAPLT